MMRRFLLPGDLIRNAFGLEGDSSHRQILRILFDISLLPEMEDSSNGFNRLSKIKYFPGAIHQCARCRQCGSSEVPMHSPQQLLGASEPKPR